MCSRYTWPPPPTLKVPSLLMIASPPSVVTQGSIMGQPLTHNTECRARTPNDLYFLGDIKTGQKEHLPLS